MKKTYISPETIAIRGRGFPVVLLHGYLESKNIWDSFAELLEDQFQLIIPDLPGHGNAGIIAETHTMEMLADYVYGLLEELGYDNVFLVGHSLGGYVTLAFAQQYSHVLSGFCLFHSHPFADTPETIEKRLREIELIRAGKKELIVNTNIPKSFAPEHVQSMDHDVEYAKEIARLAPAEGVIAMLKGMMKRTDRSELLYNTSLPVLWMLGMKDQYISHDHMIRLFPESARIVMESLMESGHMGFMEEPNKSAKILTDFLKGILTVSP